ncbi:MAG TPA: TetR/AcrR family transcriptional regulator [Acidimicrobiales bacterium]|jgi:AcrR family transcriptional regulator|nr:TetR/AcrR family transcriptional regulator [Acidimicrobiales bacterium]
MTSATRASTTARPPATRTRARRGEGELLRTEILEAAEELLMETGSEDAVSIRGVAERVGVTPPSIYRHFDDKTALLVEVCRLEFDRLGEAIDSADPETDPVAEVFRQGRAYVHFALEHPEHYRLMLLSRLPSDRDAFGDVFMSDHSTFRGFLEAVEAMLESDAVRPEITAMGAFNLTLALWSSVHGLSALMIAKPQLDFGDVDEAIDRQFELVLHGLVRDPTGRRRKS